MTSSAVNDGNYVINSSVTSNDVVSEPAATKQVEPISLASLITNGIDSDDKGPKATSTPSPQIASPLASFDVTTQSQKEVPLKIGHMKNLLILDMSRNSLSRSILSSMSGMTSLDYLDFSYNNMSGRIPSSTQLQSFGPLSYSGNVGLCGPPLTRKCPGDERVTAMLKFMRCTYEHEPKIYFSSKLLSRDQFSMSDFCAR
ncbi:leucine-rich repeat domain, L domain-like protein [Artemisia annua]|uniref:Leucine-rich repeat domain, L domain-like protein n=1 Tax=Artemisia annua TaxID=35608 RepID=A0A2U1QCW2_ARTAN|nr:leucine-rich repeat domain, L domain-like protein [Artemisia annua]